jgi:Flp pilus assembly protein TadG
MKPRKLTPLRKSKAQALVEFAIVLPLLVLLLYGLLEAGRLLFLYANVVTASRQAVRYGSASGVGNGTGNASEPRYQDCDGIRGAASKTAFLGAFDTVLIQWDNGPSASPNTYCASPTAQTDNTFTPSSSNSTRITVTVTERFNPIVPLIVPFAQRDVTAKSSRTILLSVTIEVTPTGGPTATYTPSNTPTPTVTDTPTTTPTATETPIYSPTPSLTLPPSATPLPSLTFTPTLSPTPNVTRVPSCTNVSHGTLQRTGTTMYMTITNGHSFPITLDDITISWNNDKGHQTGDDKTVRLQNAFIGTTLFWTGDIDQATYTIDGYPGTLVTIPPLSTVTLSFTFHQTYDNFDGTENIYINLWTPGCENNPIDS